MKTKKSLGQHFLNSLSYLNAVADAADIKAGETILEIGPGEGSLTSVILERGAKVIAIEKDSRLIEPLREKFKENNFELIEGDALEFDPSGYGLVASGYKVVGNIPYYITGALLKKFLSGDAQPTTLVFLLQKEVAERIVGRKSAQGRPASGGKESVLSLSVKAYGEPKYIKTVPRGAFAPAPKVDSAILAVYDISKKKFADKKHEAKFFELVKKGFSSKRKLLLNNIGKDYASVLQNTGIAEKARAEDVPLVQWLELSAD
ncbi:MAG: 16S rRNA (adenine(1518)-N(6)/adenine(1519)-N(6))-dimethyltransferase RsmA [Patescibacteria group bacterium]